MPYEKSNKQIQDSAFKMKASKYGGPMQKNFGKHLAINKKLDKDSMSGGLTGQPGKELDGPMAKKFRLFKKPTAAQQAKRDKLKSDVKKFTGGIKKAGSDVNKKLQKAGNYLSAKSIKARRAARIAAKNATKTKTKKKKSTGAATTGNDKEINVKGANKTNYTYNFGNKTPKAPAKTFGVLKTDKNKTKVKTKSQVSADKSKGVKRSDVNKKKKGFKIPTYNFKK